MAAPLHQAVKMTQPVIHQTGLTCPISQLFIQVLRRRQSSSFLACSLEVLRPASPAAACFPFVSFINVGLLAIFHVFVFHLKQSSFMLKRADPSPLLLGWWRRTFPELSAPPQGYKSDRLVYLPLRSSDCSHSLLIKKRFINRNILMRLAFDHLKKKSWHCFFVCFLLVQLQVLLLPRIAIKVTSLLELSSLIDLLLPDGSLSLSPFSHLSDEAESFWDHENATRDRLTRRERREDSRRRKHLM